MTDKETFLLALVEEWWGNKRSSELEEMLLNYEDTARVYPQFDLNDDEYEGDDDPRDLLTEAVEKDVDALFTKIREILGDA